MAQSSYWNIYKEDHPKNRLLKYSKSSKLSRETLNKLQQLRKIYQKLPAIIYTYQDPPIESQGKMQHRYIRLYPLFSQISSLNLISSVNNVIYLYIIFDLSGDQHHSMSMIDFTNS